MKPNDFSVFFNAIHGHRPFPWQERLAIEVASKGIWPNQLDIPTGLGKTAVLDVAVFSLACRVSAAERMLPRRMMLVVDRRVVVDAAYERARTIVRALRSARDGLLAEVATALRSLTTEGQSPLNAVRLRGGIYRDDTWVNDPTQPLLVCSTVDQVGSRLLFRGYGLNPYAMPIHAGLIGNDCLIVLDEAHLAQPFRQTIDAIATHFRSNDSKLSTAPLISVVMSATPGTVSASSFLINEEDRCHPLVKVRLSAEKSAELHAIKVDPKEPDVVFSQMAATAAIDMIKQFPDVRTVGVVVNRVATARAIYANLAKSGHDSILLIGRSRSVERDRLLATCWDRIRAGRTRSKSDVPLIVVATQCIEAGADIDFDALVTESASLDALRQRFGRLDRLGVRKQSPAQILHRAVVVDAVGLSDVEGTDDRVDHTVDPVYGEALEATWKWLSSIAVVSVVGKNKSSGKSAVDFGIDALAPYLKIAVDEDRMKELLAPRKNAPVLLPAHLDALVQTCPIPDPDPNPAVFLHGTTDAPADIQIVWRRDMHDDKEDQWADRVGLVPPLSGETLSIQSGAWYAWLKQRGFTARRGLLWCGADDAATGPENLADIKPGQTVVIPAEMGGCDPFGWNPTFTQPTVDLAELAWWKQRRVPVLRWDDANNPDDPTVATEQLLNWRQNETHGVLEPWVRISDLNESGYRKAIEISSDVFGDGLGAWAWMGDAIIDSDSLGEDLDAIPEDFTGDDDASALTTGRKKETVLLCEHSAGVQSWARRFALKCRLPPALVAAVDLAGWLHDVGKVDRRFQAWLLGGDSVVPSITGFQPLAKSNRNRNRAAMRRARERSRYPKGTRHEVQSLAMIHNDASLANHCGSHGIDHDLVLYLVASHHGRCRPFAPVVDDLEPVETTLRHDGSSEMPVFFFTASSRHGMERLGSGVAARFWRLVRAYGWHQLAWYEAVLRLADQRRSREEREGTPTRRGDRQ